MTAHQVSAQHLTHRKEGVQEGQGQLIEHEKHVETETNTACPQPKPFMAS